MSSRLCRRSLVAGAATLPALTVPAGATAIAPTVFADIGHTVGDRSRAAWLTRAQHIVETLSSRFIRGGMA
jgi:hypothetical protein